MERNSFYESLVGYINKYTEDEHISNKYIDILIKANIPLQTFITSLKLFNTFIKIISFYEKDCKIQNSNNSNQSIFDKIMRKKDNYKILRIENLNFNKELILITCCVISSKYYKDISFTNESWEEVSYLNYKLINEVERIILSEIDYTIDFDGENEIIKEINEYLNKDLYNIMETKPVKKKQNIKTVIKKIFCR